MRFLAASRSALAQVRPPRKQVVSALSGGSRLIVSGLVGGDVSTKMIYTHFLNRGGRGVWSLADG